MTGRPGDDVVVATGLTDDQRAMVLANTGLIGWMLARKAKHLIDGHYSEADAWQDGVFGLARAVQLFDPDRGYRFSTYAMPLIFQSIQRGRGRCEERGWRRLYEVGKSPDYERPLSLDYQPSDPFGGSQPGMNFADTLADASADTEGDGWAAAVLSTLRDACRDPLDHAVLDAMMAGTGAGSVGPAHGFTAKTACNRANRLRTIGARLVCEVAA